MRLLAKQSRTSLQGLTQHAELALLKVVQAAVNNASTVAGGTGGEIVALHQKHGSAGLRTLPGKSHAIDSTANDGDVDVLGQWAASGKALHTNRLDAFGKE